MGSSILQYLVIMGAVVISIKKKNGCYAKVAFCIVLCIRRASEGSDCNVVDSNARVRLCIGAPEVMSACTMSSE